MLLHSSAFIFDWTFFILAGNNDSHNILDEFEIRPDLITDCGVSFPLNVLKKSNKRMIGETLLAL